MNFLLPKSDKAARQHRKEKREREIEVVVNELELYIEDLFPEVDELSILEFGSGRGYQSGKLSNLGSLITLDLNLMKDSTDPQMSLEILLNLRLKMNCLILYFLTMFLSIYLILCRLW